MTKAVFPSTAFPSLMINLLCNPRPAPTTQNPPARQKRLIYSSPNSRAHGRVPLPTSLLSTSELRLSSTNASWHYGGGWPVQISTYSTQKYIPSAQHPRILLQVNHATGNLPSPFVTNHNTVVLLIADLLTYAGTLETAKILQASNNANIYELMNNISLLCGTLALVLLVLLLVPTFGWFTLACWAVYFVIIGAKSYQTLRTLCTDAVCYVRDKMEEVMMLIGIEEAQNQNEDA